MQRELRVNKPGDVKRGEQKAQSCIMPAKFFKSPSWADRQIELLLLINKVPTYFVGDLEGIKKNWEKIRSYDAVFYALNPCSIETESWNQFVNGSIGRNKHSITGIDFIYVDVDPVRPPETCSTEEEKQAAKKTTDKICQYLAGQGFPDPWVVDSGNGYHLFYRCDFDVEDNESVKQLLKLLAGRFDTKNVKVDQSVGDLARMCRMPGTYNRKGYNTPERPHRKCHIIKVGDSRGVDRDDLVNLLESTGSVLQSEISNLVDGEIERPEVITKASKYLSKMPPSVSGIGGHDYLYAAVCKAVELGCNRAEARLSIESSFNPRCRPPWSPKDLDHKLNDAFTNTTPDINVQSSAPERRQGDPNFIGFVPDWSDIHMPILQACNPMKDTDFRSLLLEHYLQLRSGYAVPTVPAEFVRQFFFSFPFEKNWRSRFLNKIGRMTWRAIDSHRSRQSFSECLFCNNGYPSHTHLRFTPCLHTDLQPFFVVRRKGKLFFDDQRKEKFNFGVSLGKEAPLYTRKDSFIYFRGRNTERYTDLKRQGVLRKAYWPILLFGWKAGLEKYAIRALFGITNEITHINGKHLVVTRENAPTVKAKTGLCPELELAKEYVVFGGNRKVAKGQGYALFGRTEKGWAYRLGLGDVYKVERKAWRMKAARFVFDVLLGKLIPPEMGLTVVSYHSGRNEWKGLRDLQAACRHHAGFDWIDGATIRIYAPVDWRTQWRAYLSRKLGYSWIPSSSSECTSAFNPGLNMEAKLLDYIRSRQLTRVALSEELSEAAGYKISVKKIQRYLTQKTKTHEFTQLLTEFLQSQ